MTAVKSLYDSCTGDRKINRNPLMVMGILTLSLALPAIAPADTPSERDLREFSVLGERMDREDPPRQEPPAPGDCQSERSRNTPAVQPFRSP